MSIRIIHLILIFWTQIINASEHFITLPLPSCNGNLQFLNRDFPVGATNIGDVPFDISNSENNYWHSEFAAPFGSTSVSLEVPVDLKKVTGVYLLMNTFWGETEPGSFCDITFNFSDGTFFESPLDGNVDIRDYLDNYWTNSINGSTTTSWFSTETDGYGGPNTHRLDRVYRDLSGHANKTLKSITIRDRGGYQFQRVFVAAITVSADIKFVQVNLDPPPTNNKYIIPADPVMPNIKAYASIHGLEPDPTPDMLFNWNFQLTLPEETLYPTISFADRILQDLKSTGSEPVSLSLNKEKEILGGRLSIQATALLPIEGELLYGITDPELEILGTNPPRTKIREYIEKTIRKKHSGNDALYYIAALKKIASKESYQCQFDAPADGGVGPVLPNGNGDFGMGVFQITKVKQFNQPYLQIPEVLYNWQVNVDYGCTKFFDSFQVVRKYVQNLKNSNSYKLFIDGINEKRAVSKLPEIKGYPLPDYTEDGFIGAVDALGNPRNQFLETVVRLFNGAGTKPLELGGVPAKYNNGTNILMHEFMPDEEYLISIKNPSNLHLDAKVWKRIPLQDRGSSGEPDYVNKVIAASEEPSNPGPP